MTDIYQDIAAEIPRLRRYARALVRDVSAADDLVQECLTRALGKLHLWQEGSNLRAWLCTIMHNQYVNEIRRMVREGTIVELSEVDEQLAHPPPQDKVLELERIRDWWRKISTRSYQMTFTETSRSSTAVAPARQR